MLALFVPSVLAGIGFAQQGDPGLTEVWEPEPAVVQPGGNATPPSDAIVLFDGTDLSAWVDPDGNAPHWTVADGAMTSRCGVRA